MSDLSDKELEDLQWLGNDMWRRGVDEIRRRRAVERVHAQERLAVESGWVELHSTARAADEERVRSVVREAIDAELTERKLYVVKPHQQTMNEIVLHAYGHQQACDAVALQGDDLQSLLTAIATRAAKQLATAAVRLSDDEVKQLRHHIEDHKVTCGYSCSIIERLLATRSTP